MVSALVFVLRLMAGFVVLALCWFVLDRIHDRNTEIIVSAIGLNYVFVFLISRRLDYFGLSVFSFFGRTVSYIQHIPHDQVLREEIGGDSRGRHLYLNLLFAALVEILCVFRLLTSLLRHGWDILSDPINTLIGNAL